MEREILFRGKRVDGRGWVAGDLIHSSAYPEKLWITESKTLFDKQICSIGAIEVDPATVGQYTGLTDKNGVKIFELDIAHCVGGELFQGYHENDENIVIEDIADGTCVYLSAVETIEVIGNIHDNPELLGTKT